MGVPSSNGLIGLSYFWEASEVAHLKRTLVCGGRHDEDFQGKHGLYIYVRWYVVSMHACTPKSPKSMYNRISHDGNPTSPELFKRYADGSSNYANKDFNQVLHLALMKDAMAMATQNALTVWKRPTPPPPPACLPTRSESSHSDCERRSTQKLLNHKVYLVKEFYYGTLLG